MHRGRPGPSSLASVTTVRRTDGCDALTGRRAQQPSMRRTVVTRARYSRRAVFGVATTGVALGSVASTISMRRLRLFCSAVLLGAMGW